MKESKPPSLFYFSPRNAPLRAGGKNHTSFTVMAAVGHTSTQLSQPRHSSILTGSDLPSLISNTLAGQVSTHSPFPSHLSLSTVTWYMAPLVYLLFKNFKLLPIAILIILYTSLLFHDPDHKKPPLYWPFSEDEKYISLCKRMSTEKRTVPSFTFHFRSWFQNDGQDWAGRRCAPAKRPDQPLFLSPTFPPQKESTKNIGLSCNGGSEGVPEKKTLSPFPNPTPLTPSSL